MPHSAGVSSRLQVVRPRRCAAAGAPPGPARRPPAPQACGQKDEKRSDEPLAPGPVFIERLAKIIRDDDPDCCPRPTQQPQGSGAPSNLGSPHV